MANFGSGLLANTSDLGAHRMTGSGTLAPWSLHRMGVARRVLRMDADAASRILGRYILQELGLGRFAEASDGERALVRADALQPDVTLLDLGMTGIGGPTALPPLRLTGAAATIAVVSRRETRTGDQTRLGATGFISKTGGNEELLTQMRPHLTQEYTAQEG